MNSRNFLLAALFFAGMTSSFAQSNLLNAKTPDEIGKKTAEQDSLDNDKPLPYGYVGDRDVLLARKVWEVIDLDQRINFPMYFPVEDNIGGLLAELRQSEGDDFGLTSGNVEPADLFRGDFKQTG